MLISNNKTNLVLNSKIELNETEGKGKGHYFVSRFIEAGLAHYENLGDILITKETLDKFVQSMVGCPVIINHKDIDDKNVDKERVGVISRVWYNEADGWYYCEGVITDEQAVDLVKNQGWNVSCSYNFVSTKPKDKYHGKDYDMEFIDGEFLHLAIVETPRYEGANIVVNSADNAKDWDGNEGNWITVNGNHLFIKKGQSKDEVVKQFIDKQEDKSDKQTDTKDKSEKEGKKYTWDNKEYTADELMEQGFHPMKYSGSIYKDDHLTYLEKNDGKKLYRVKISEDEYKELKQKKDKSGDGKKEGNKETNSTKDFRNHINRIEKLIKKYNLEPHEEDELLDELGSFESKLDEGLEPRDEEELREELFDFEDDIKRHQEMKKVNNIGDITMTVLNELKDFIMNVVNNEKETKVDKRKLIDEIGGILKDKVDDEIIKTIIKKAEEIAYNPSEDDKSDNCGKAKNEEEKEEKEKATENEDEEKEEKFEEEKEIADVKNKCKNEDKEDEEKVENSINKTREILFGGIQAQKTEYLTRDERIELGNEY